MVKWFRIQAFLVITIVKQFDLFNCFVSHTEKVCDSEINDSMHHVAFTDPLLKKRAMPVRQRF